MTETDESTETEEQAPESAPDADEEAEAEEDEERLATPEEAAGEPTEAVTAQGVTPEEWEERHKKAEKAFRTYTNAIGRIYEEDAVAYLQCPLCADAPAGFIHPQNAGKFPDDVQAAVMHLLGHTAAGNVKSDPYSSVCQTCDGWGVVRTGSHVPNHETRVCLDCKGLGYRPLGDTLEERLAVANGSERTDSGVLVPAQTSVESPELEMLRLQGYTIIPPMRTEG